MLKQNAEAWSEASPPGLTGDREFRLAAASLKLVAESRRFPVIPPVLKSNANALLFLFGGEEDANCLASGFRKPEPYMATEWTRGQICYRKFGTHDRIPIPLPPPFDNFCNYLQ